MMKQRCCTEKKPALPKIGGEQSDNLYLESSIKKGSQELKEGTQKFPGILFPGLCFPISYGFTAYTEDARSTSAGAFAEAICTKECMHDTP